MDTLALRIEHKDAGTARGAVADGARVDRAR